MNTAVNENILQEALSYGIISMDDVHEQIMNSKRNQVKKLHPYTVTPPCQSNPRWQTYYKPDNGARKLIRANTEQELWDKLIPLYLKECTTDKILFYDLFTEWLAYKSTMANSPNTITRHRQHYEKYLKTSSLHSKKIKQIDELFLEQECNRIVKAFNLARKEWTNVKTILKGMFEYALRKKYLSENPLLNVKIMVKFRQVNKKTGKTETYNTEELEQLNRYLDAKFTETGDTSFLAVRLNFYLGLRVGELVALKWEDITDEKHLHIVREETRYQEENKLVVVEHTKTHTDRFVYLVPKATAILEKIEPQGEFIFMRNGNRITSRQIAYVLEKYAERHGLRTKSTHKMRKTVASTLSSKNVPLDAIRELLGHSDLQTTLGYIYNPLTETETYNLISNAL